MSPNHGRNLRHISDGTESTERQIYEQLQISGGDRDVTTGESGTQFMEVGNTFVLRDNEAYMPLGNKS